MGSCGVSYTFFISFALKQPCTQWSNEHNPRMPPSPPPPLHDVYTVCCIMSIQSKYDTLHVQPQCEPALSTTPALRATRLPPLGRTTSDRSSTGCMATPCRFPHALYAVSQDSWIPWCLATPSIQPGASFGPLPHGTTPLLRAVPSCSPCTCGVASDTPGLPLGQERCHAPPAALLQLRVWRVCARCLHAMVWSLFFRPHRGPRRSRRRGGLGWMLSNEVGAKSRGPDDATSCPRCSVNRHDQLSCDPASSTTRVLPAIDGLALERGGSPAIPCCLHHHTAGPGYQGDDRISPEGCD